MNSYRITQRADRDLINIYLYTLETFGFKQAEDYTQRMKWCFAALADHPRMGRLAEEVRPGVRRHEHGSHVIFYREDAAAGDILILAVLHARMRPDLI